MTITDPLIPALPPILLFVQRVHDRTERAMALLPTADPHAAFQIALDAELAYLTDEYADSDPSIQNQLDAYFASTTALFTPVPPAADHPLSELADYLEQLLVTRRQSPGKSDASGVTKRINEENE